MWLVMIPYIAIIMFNTNVKAVSYTHLDVYKRQAENRPTRDTPGIQSGSDDEMISETTSHVHIETASSSRLQMASCLLYTSRCV